MSASLGSELMTAFRGGPLNSVASALGESPAKIQTAMSSVLSALTGILASKVATKEGASDMLDLIRRNGLDSFGDLSKVTAAPDGITRLVNTGKPLLDSIFGDRSSSITDWVSSAASVPRSVATSLLSMALPLMLGTIGKRLRSSGWNASSLMNLMAGQPVQDAPAGLAAALGTQEGARRQEATAASQAVVGGYSGEARSGPVWWKWVLPVLLLALLGYFFLRPSAPVPTPTLAGLPSAGRSSASPTPAIPALGPLVDRTLQNSVTLRVPGNGIESKLIAFIEDPSSSVDRDTWFAFDRLEFDTDSAALRSSSSEQLVNIAEILKAYPGVNVKIGGYTDNIGDAAHNLKLSADRAMNTMNEIAALGIDKSRLASEGYGMEHPIADNSTEEGRQRNRRIDIRVTKK